MNRLILVATVIDPRFKMLVVDFWFRKVLRTRKGVEMTNMVRSTIDCLYLEYSANSGISGVRMSTNDPNYMTLVMVTLIMTCRMSSISIGLYKIY